MSFNFLCLCSLSRKHSIRSTQTYINRPFGCTIRSAEASVMNRAKDSTVYKLQSDAIEKVTRASSPE